LLNIDSKALNAQSTIGEIEMMTLTQLTELLGWASVLNIGFLFFATILLVIMKPLITTLHSKIFGISKNDLSLIYFKYLANYKMLSFVFIVAPYLSLKIMGQ
jgi:hypothetical protein